MSRQERWQVGERPSLDIRVPVGAIEVYAGDAGVVQIIVDSSDVDDFEITKVGDRISVRHPSRWRLRGHNSRLVANVPIGSDVEISSSSGEVHLIGHLGVVRVRTASGDVELDDVTRADVTTTSGAVSCGQIGGDASVSSASGDCTLARVGGRLQVTLTSGALRVDDCGGDLTAGSTSGEVRVGRCDGSDIAIRSISGDVRLGLPSGIRVEADISTLSGRATLPEPVLNPDPGERRPVRLQVKTVSGDIRIERT